MPIVGSVGAIQAGHRATRRRQNNASSIYTSSMRSAALQEKRAEAAQTALVNQVKKEPAISETASVTSLGSKSSVFSMFSNKVSETAGFIKKTQQGIAEKMQKGLNMGPSGQCSKEPTPALTTKGTSDTMRKQSNAAADPKAEAAAKKEAAVAAHLAETKKRNAAWMQTLEQMGFERPRIQEAMGKLGGSPKQLDDILEALLAMTTCAPSRSASSDTFTVTLRRGPGDRLGIAVDTSNPERVTIDSIAEGLLAKWNAANPNLQVEAGAVILDVNGTNGNPKELVQLMMTASNITLLIKPTSSGRATNSSLSARVAPSALAGSASRPACANRVQRHVSFSDDTAVISRGKKSFAQIMAETKGQGEVKTAPVPSQEKEFNFEPTSRATEDDLARVALAHPRVLAEDDAAASVEIVDNGSCQDAAPQLEDEGIQDISPWVSDENIIDIETSLSPLSSPAFAAHVLVDAGDECAIPDLAAKLIEMAFTQASEQVIGEMQAEASLKRKQIIDEQSCTKIVDEHSNTKSPVMGGA